MKRKLIKLVIKILIERSDLDRDDLHEISKYADNIIVSKFIRGKN